MEKKTIKDEIQELRRLDPSFVKLFKDVSDDSLESFVKKVSGRAKSFKVWASMEEALNQANVKLKNLEQHALSRAKAKRFAFLASLCSLLIGASLPFVFELNVVDILFDDFHLSDEIISALVLSLLFCAFTNLYITTFLSARLCFLFMQKERVDDPIIRSMLSLYIPSCSKDDEATIIRIKTVREDIKNLCAKEYSTREIARSISQFDPFSKSRGTKFGFGKGLYVKRKKKIS